MSKNRFIFNFILIYFLILAEICSSQSIKGTIRDTETKNSLANANIVIENTLLGTSSNTEGEFKLQFSTAGEFVIHVSMIGYKTEKRTITVRADSILLLNIELEPTVISLSPVMVTGKRDRNAISVPSIESAALDISTSFISKREIKRQGAKTLIEAMNYVPGALIETRGRKVKQFFSIRGQRYPYPDYAVNGAWQREFLETPYFFSSNDIEGVEVIRSSAALLTGLSGLAGVINIITKQYERSETNREIEYGSFGTFRTHISHGAKIGKIAYAAGVGFRHSDGPQNKHAAEGMANFYGSVNWNPNKKLFVTMSLFHLNGKRELALADPPAAKRFQNELWTFDPFRSTLTNLKLHYQPSPKTSTEVLMYYTHRDPTLIDEDENSHEIARFSERDYEWGTNIIQSLSLSENNVLRFGGLYNHWIAPNGKRFYLGRRNDLETYSIVIVDEHRFNRWNIDAGLRWAKTFMNEYGAFNIEGSGKPFKNVTPIKDEWEPSIYQGSFGAVYYFPGSFSLYFSGSAGEIIPRNGTLDINFQKPKNERRIKIDAGLRKSWYGIGQISFAGFFVNQSNAIVLSGKTADLENRIMELYINRNQDQFGVEIETRFTDLFNLAEAFFNITAMSSRIEIEEKKQRNEELPQIISNGGIYAHFAGFDFNILGKYVSTFESIRFVANTAENPATPQPLGDFLTLDITTGWSFGEKYQTRIYLEAQNLTNKKYSTVVGYPDFGRRFTLGVRQSF